MAPSVMIVHMSHAERDGLRTLSAQYGESEERTLRRLLRAALPEVKTEVQKAMIKPPRQDKRDIWGRVKAYALVQVAACGYVAASGISQSVGISYATAGRYIDRLIRELDWTSEPTYRPSRGKVAAPS